MFVALLATMCQTLRAVLSGSRMYIIGPGAQGVVIPIWIITVQPHDRCRVLQFAY